MLAVLPSLQTNNGVLNLAPLTEMVCWSRMQSEAGQDLQSIILRKEIERSAGKGLFCWGVGNAPSRSIPGLARSGADVDVVFSLMKSHPKAIDSAPASLRIWRSYFDQAGHERPLPPATLITSRGDTGARAKSVHYALMCRSELPLSFGDFGPFDPSAYRNVSEIGGAVGASQVTALLRRVSREVGAPSYKINLRAKLELGYWVRLGDAIDVSSEKRTVLERVLSDLSKVSATEWIRALCELRAGPAQATASQSSLF